MKAFFISLLLVVVLAGVPGVFSLLGGTFWVTSVLPPAAMIFFVVGVIYRVIIWAKSPVPFRIPTTGGQEKSLPWVNSNPLDNPSGIGGVIGRMVLEVLFFRSLFRNTRTEMAGGRPIYLSSKWLWFFALIFHWGLLITILRHLRFFLAPIPSCIDALIRLDGFFALGLPPLYLSNLLIVAGLAFLLLRRLFAPRVRYISNASDYFALLLLIMIGVTGMLTRHFYPVDLLGVKSVAQGWLNFRFLSLREPPSYLFLMHLFYVSLLLFWFPWGKLMHAGGVFLSPTRNLANDNRERRHVNPWDHPVKVHTYEEYENEFRQQMKDAGLPVEKE